MLPLEYLFSTKRVYWRPDPLNSLLQLLSQYGNILQTKLFPVLKEGAGELEECHQRFVRVLTLLKLDRFTDCQRGPGRPATSRAHIARAFVAKAVLGIPLTKGLRERLVSDAVLRSLCGWQACQRCSPKVDLLAGLGRILAQPIAAAGPCGADGASVGRPAGGAYQPGCHRPGGS